MPDKQDNIKTFLESHLATEFVGRQLYQYTTITSTMDVAKELARDGAAEGTVIIANKQTWGKGRAGRAWLSPEGNLAMSIILRPSMENLPQLIMVASLAVVRAIKSVSGLETHIKWPNDVMVKNKKICGILIESEVKGTAINFAIIGIGINVNLNPVAFPEISSLATSLLQELGTEVSRNELCYVVLSELEKLYLEAKAGAPTYKEWQQHMNTLGKSIRVKLGESVEQGIAESVTKGGNLMLRDANGNLTEIIAGDVEIIKD